MAMIAPSRRVVETFVDHGAPLPFLELCRRVITPKTRYLVLDLDRTVHYGLNMGELLGFERCAQQAYGLDKLARFEPKRRGRWMLDWSDPLGLARYLKIAVQVWAYPGLFYLLWGKVASKTNWLRRMSFRKFGSHPIRIVQQVPQMALLRHLEPVDLDTLKDLARRVWDRSRWAQVIEREDLEQVRGWAPNIEIVLTSASPRAMVEVAAENLGVDIVGYSTRERINSGEAKIEHLRKIRSDLDQVEVVGISDTGYREDHCWAQNFTKVVDINSNTPFGVVVEQNSPLREVHSAQVLTHAEKMARAQGEADYWDPRRKNPSDPRQF